MGVLIKAYLFHILQCIKLYTKWQRKFWYTDVCSFGNVIEGLYWLGINTIYV